MRRLLLAAGIALSLHVLLLSGRADWIRQKRVNLPRPVPLSIALGYIIPEREPSPVKKKAEEKSEKSKVIKKRPLKPEPKETPSQKTLIEKNPSPRKEMKKIITEDLRPVSTAPKRQKEEVIENTLPESLKDVAVRKVPNPLPVQKEEDTVEKAMSSIKEEEANEPATPLIKETQPVYRKNPPPGYPSSAKRRRYEGTVVLEVLVSRQGRVDDLLLSRSSGYPVLDQAAIKSVKSWLFEPGKRGNQIVEMWVRVPVRFELD
ncbi:energy transducer TonB [Thermodesulfobacteriota bacterium]